MPEVTAMSVNPLYLNFQMSDFQQSEKTENQGMQERDNFGNLEAWISAYPHSHRSKGFARFGMAMGSRTSKSVELGGSPVFMDFDIF